MDILASLRSGAWITRERVRVYGTILIAAYAIVVAWSFSGSGVLDPLRRPVGTDFLSFYTASSLLHAGEGAAAYSAPALHAAETSITGPGAAEGSYYAWLYPPTAFLLVYPLAWMPYLAAYALAMTVAVGGVLVVVWRFTRSGAALGIALAAPALFLCVTHGQVTLPIAVVLVAGLQAVRSSPAVAGALLGIVTLKPHLGLLVPIALVAGRRWRALAFAALSAACLGFIATAFFGADAWAAFVSATPYARGIVEQGLVEYRKQASLLAGARLLGASLPVASAAQVLGTAATVAIVAWTWARRRDARLERAVLLCGAVVASPFALDYDLLLPALALAALAPVWLQTGLRPWEAAIAAGAWAVPLLQRPLGVPVAQVFTLALLLAIVARVRGAPAAEPASP